MLRGQMERDVGARVVGGAPSLMTIIDQECATARPDRVADQISEEFPVLDPAGETGLSLPWLGAGAIYGYRLRADHDRPAAAR